MLKNNKNTINIPPVTPLKGKLWIPVKGFEGHLDTELTTAQETNSTIAVPDLFAIEEPFIKTHHKRATEAVPQLVYREVYPEQVFWAQLCWEQPFTAHFGSIAEAATLLRNIQRNWAHHPVNCFRRAELITQRLPYISKKNKKFPYSVPLAEMGGWALLDEHTLIASAKTSSPFPLGSITFEQDRENPPSRAYLKLWEALTLLDFYYRKAEACQNDSLPQDWSLPQKNSLCIDAGASPGGWTWVLNNSEASITAIDRSPLADSLMKQPNIRFIQHDAFTIRPEDLGHQDWIFSDVICYPERLYTWIQRWLNSGLCNKFVCTIKMQGQPDSKVIERFAAIPHSKIVHLTANKHELTWMHAPFITK